MKAINVNKDTCIGCGACVAIDDEHFTFDNDGKSEVISNENLGSANLTNAIESCPVAAISLMEADDINKSEDKDESCPVAAISLMEADDINKSEDKDESCQGACEGCANCHNEKTNQ